MSANTKIRIVFNGALLLVLLIIILAGCSTWHGTGTVVRMDYDAAHTYTTYNQTCVAYSTTGGCNAWTLMPDHTYYPAEWSLKVKDAKDGKTHKVEVSETTWNNTYVGATFQNGE